MPLVHQNVSAVVNVVIGGNLLWQQMKLWPLTCLRRDRGEGLNVGGALQRGVRLTGDRG